MKPKKLSKKNINHIGVINIEDLSLPKDLIKIPEQKAWTYTCRVCDDDTYDGCDNIKANEFFKEFESQIQKKL